VPLGELQEDLHLYEGVPLIGRTVARMNEATSGGLDLNLGMEPTCGFAHAGYSVAKTPANVFAGEAIVISACGSDPC
jgi:hypothetical protein